MDKLLLLIDGSSFLFRAFHAMPNLTSPSGNPTGAIYGIVNMLKQLQKRYPTSHIGCIFDAPGGSFRDEIHPEYKANRSETPQELIEQIEPIYNIINSLGLPLIVESGVEADDVIGSLATYAKDLGYKVIIASGDKDFSQLVDPSNQITIVNTMSNEVLDYNGVINKFGIKPEQFIDYLSLVGDTVDNVPGVPKCGPKTAVKWLTQYETLENIIAHSDEIKGVVGENLRNSIKWLTTAKTLVTIHCQLNLGHVIPKGMDSLVLSTPDNNSLQTLYHDLGFKTWLNQLKSTNDVPSEFKTPKLDNPKPSVNLSLNLNLTKPPLVDFKPSQHILINSVEELDQLVTTITKDNLAIGILIITDDLANVNYLKHIFINYNHNTYLINNNPKHDDLFGDSNPHIDFMPNLETLFKSNTPKVFANYKEALEILIKFGLSLNNVTGDITLAHYIKNSKTSHHLSSIYPEYLNLDILDIPSITAKALTKNDPWNLQSIDALIENAYLITDAIIAIEDIINKSLDAKERHLYQQIELPLCPILVEMEFAGIMLDLNKFADAHKELESKIGELENNIYKKANQVFNISSPKQLSEVLFDNLQLPIQGIKKNTNGFSTDEDSLKHLAQSGFDIANLLLEHRSLSKLLNTYVSKLPKLVDNNHRLHTTFDQAYVASGRLSSRDPNLQNIPASTTWGNRIREGFIAKAGCKLISADYSQIELRILAHISQDQNLIDAFNYNQDIHSSTASNIFHKEISQVNKDERRYAKTINFSLLYGKTVFGLANELNIDRATAKLYIDTYFAKYPKIKSTLDGIKEFAHEHGYVETIFGRKVFLSNINSNNRILREADERVALNAPMQGSSADIIKIAMCNIDKWLKQNQLQSKMILQIHDELILEVPDNEVELVSQNLPNLMTQGFDLSVKLLVDAETATCWSS